MTSSSRVRLWYFTYLTGMLLLIGGALSAAPRSELLLPQGKENPKTKTVRGRFQTRPGGPLEDVEVKVRPAPTDLQTVGAKQAKLKGKDIVLGLIMDGRAMAFPVRYLALYEVVDQRVGQTPVAPTW